MAVLIRSFAMRIVSGVLLAVAGVLMIVPRESPAEGEFLCPITHAPSPKFVPPAPHEATGPSENGFLYGSAGLWTNVVTHWHMQTGRKLPYFRQGFDWQAEPNPRLQVVARRLDAPDSLVWAEPASSGFTGGTTEAGSFMATGVGDLTPGCWEISAHYNPSPDYVRTLTYTVSVEP